MTLPAEVTTHVCSNPADTWACIGRRWPSLASPDAGDSKTVADHGAETIKTVIIATTRRVVRLSRRITPQYYGWVARSMTPVGWTVTVTMPVQ